MSRMTTGVTGDEIEVTRAAPDRVRLEVSGEEIALSLEDAEMLSALLKQALDLPKMDESQPCLMASGICPRHARVHGREAEELRAGVEALMREHDRKVPVRALQRLLDNVDARDSLAFVEAQDAMRAEMADLKARLDVRWHDGQPPMQALVDHHVRGGCWMIKRVDGDPFMVRTGEVRALRFDSCRPVQPDGTPMPWPEVSGG